MPQAWTRSLIYFNSLHSYRYSWKTVVLGGSFKDGMGVTQLAQSATNLSYLPEIETSENCPINLVTISSTEGTGGGRFLHEQGS